MRTASAMQKASFSSRLHELKHLLPCPEEHFPWTLQILPGAECGEPGARIKEQGTGCRMPGAGRKLSVAKSRLYLIIGEVIIGRTRFKVQIVRRSVQSGRSERRKNIFNCPNQLVSLGMSFTDELTIFKTNMNVNSFFYFEMMCDCCMQIELYMRKLHPSVKGAGL